MDANGTCSASVVYVLKSLLHGLMGWSQSVIAPLPGHIHLLLLVDVLCLVAVYVLCLFLKVPWVGLQSVTVAFPALEMASIP